MRFYKLTLRDCEFAFELDKTEEGDPPKDTLALLHRYRSVFTDLKNGGDCDERRRHYAKLLLNEAETALEDVSGSVETPRLEEAERGGLECRYGRVTLSDGNLHFAKAPWAGASLPDEAMTFLSRADKMFNKVKFLLKGKDSLNSYLLQLHSHARNGLEDGDLKSAAVALDLFAEQFVDEEGPSIRQKYVSNTLQWAAIIAFGALAVYFIFGFMLSFPKIRNFLPVEIDWPSVSLATLSLIVGVSLGVTFFAFVRNLNVNFDSLGRFDPAALSSPLRFTLVGIVTAITCLLMGVGLLKIEIGGVKLDDFSTEPKIAILLGVICGYADVTITGMLTNVLGTIKPGGAKD